MADKFSDSYVELAVLWVSKSGKSLTGRVVQPMDKNLPRKRLVISSEALLIYQKEKDPKPNCPVARIFGSKQFVRFEDEEAEEVDDGDTPF